VAKKTKKIPPMKSQKGIEKTYQKGMAKLGKAMVLAVKKEVLSYLKIHQSTYVIDAVGDDLIKIFNRLNAQFSGLLVSNYAEELASTVVTKTEKANKSKFDRSVQRVTGVDLGSILAAEGLEDFTALSVSRNVQLIKTLPEQYLSQVETIVTNGVSSGLRYSEIEKQIMAKTGSATSKLAGRIKTIARNEIQTINSQINLRRASSLGIKKGIYETSDDERVRPCHAELDGVEYDLAKGAWSKSCGKFIQPGITDINCRCSFSPLIEVA